MGTGHSLPSLDVGFTQSSKSKYSKHECLKAGAQPYSPRKVDDIADNECGSGIHPSQKSTDSAQVMKASASPAGRK